MNQDQDTFNHDKGQKSFDHDKGQKSFDHDKVQKLAISGRCLHWMFLNFLQWIFSLFSRFSV